MSHAWHCISRSAVSYQVELADGRTLDARLAGRDERTDIAVLKVDGNEFKPLSFADPLSIEVGEPVVAIGFALDLGATPTVTKGVVSALHRVINEMLDIPGGPLLDAQGNVAGINTAGPRGGSGASVQGISFAVSGQVARPIVRSLIETRRVRRGFLGVVPASVGRQIAQTRNLSMDTGAILVRVDPGSLADRAGLRAGDVVTKIGETEIKSAGDITSALNQHGPNDRIRVEYQRGGQSSATDVTLGEAPTAVG